MEYLGRENKMSYYFEGVNCSFEIIKMHFDHRKFAYFPVKICTTGILLPYLSGHATV